MSVDATTGITSSAAGSPLAQTDGSEAARSQHAVASQEQRAIASASAAGAAGIAQADGEDHRGDERDPDGRRIWIIDASKHRPSDIGPLPEPGRPPSPDGNCGGQLDVSG
jgi:hypothetical protein